ncbi:MAG: GNAT family N-acetyltransferase [Dehalococcoidales bacterium]|nr:GNAT family N-acetyltransferase [Dehalococcoidales bacterium]
MKIKTTLKVVPMSKSDKAVIMDILRATVEFNLEEVDTAEQLIDRYLTEGTSSGYHLLVAKAGSEVSGYICYGPRPLTESTWDVYWMAVNPKNKGQGIGTSLLKVAERNIKKQKGLIILIETSSIGSYELTRKFYLNAGYKIISRIPDFYSLGDGLVVFHKRLG